MTTAPSPQDDKELLELAAKAAGMRLAGWEPCEGGYYTYSRKGSGDVETWRPLTDDGDALRLAVACDMTICADGLATVSACSGYGRDKVMVTQTVSESGGDKNAATRRAIVRAAAEIARQESSTGGIE